MSDRKKTLGEIAYDGYYDKTGGRTWNNYPMPLWADLHVNVRFAWEAGAASVAAEVRQQTLGEVVEMLQAALAEQEAQEAVSQ